MRRAAAWAPGQNGQAHYHRDGRVATVRPVRDGAVASIRMVRAIAPLSERTFPTVEQARQWATAEIVR